MSKENLPAIIESGDFIFSNMQSFENGQRMAKLLASSELVPATYKGNMPNCLIALEISQRLKASPLLIMQNLHIIEGRPSWSSQFLIATINACGRYSPLRFEVTKDANPIEVQYTEHTWEKGADGKSKKVPINKKTTINNLRCIAWAIEKETGQRLESTEISLEMAIKEGWYFKNGSKWQTMLDQMLRYRSSSFFARVYSPELTMGMQTADEMEDMKDVTPVSNKLQEMVDSTPKASKPPKEEIITDNQKQNIIDAETIPGGDKDTIQDEEAPLSDRVNSMLAEMHMDNNKKDTQEFTELWNEVYDTKNEELKQKLKDALLNTNKKTT